MIGVGGGTHPPCLPTADEELLLRSGLAEGDDAAESWSNWRRRVRLDDVDHGSMRLLPLAYRNLSRLGIHDPDLDRLKGVYRHAWSTNQLLFHQAAGVVRALEDAGIPTILLKGAALSVLYYRDGGARTMDDVDVLVPLDRAADAFELLTGLGWAPDRPLPAHPIHVRNGDVLRDRGDHMIDLHWNALSAPSTDADLWATAIPIELRGVRTRALGAPEQLLHVCVHGLRRDLTGRTRWVADALTVLRGSSELDWRRLLDLARSRQLTSGTAIALGYLRRDFAAPVPPKVIAELESAPSPSWERIGLRAALRPPGRLQTLGLAWERYRRLQLLGDVASPLPRSFLAYTQGLWGFEHRRQFIAHAALRGLGIRKRGTESWA